MAIGPSPETMAWFAGKALVPLVPPRWTPVSEPPSSSRSPPLERGRSFSHDSSLGLLRPPSRARPNVWRRVHTCLEKAEAAAPQDTRRFISGGAPVSRFTNLRFEASLKRRPRVPFPLRPPVRYGSAAPRAPARAQNGARARRAAARSIFQGERQETGGKQHRAPEKKLPQQEGKKQKENEERRAPASKKRKAKPVLSLVGFLYAHIRRASLSLPDHSRKSHTKEGG